MINEASIKCFMALCETLSFTEAARQLFMTQQSVSKYIAKLEEDLGFQLFQRTHHYVAMTRAKNELHIFSLKERYGRRQEPSRFIGELLFDREKAKEKGTVWHKV